MATDYTVIPPEVPVIDPDDTPIQITETVEQSQVKTPRSMKTRCAEILNTITALNVERDLLIDEMTAMDSDQQLDVEILNIPAKVTIA